MSMELELGLALSSSSSSSSSCKLSAGFDLLDANNGSVNKRKLLVDFPDADGEGQGDSFSFSFSSADSDSDSDSDFRGVPKTLPLLVWNKFDNNKKPQTNSIFIRHTHSCRKFEDEANGVIGWPPVKSSRKKHKVNKSKSKSKSSSVYVKVQMEGVGIARKVDLNLHTSYQTLLVTLADMFAKSYEDVKLTYQDKEGDWLLAGDVPWRSFVETVQRLKLLRNNNTR